MRIKTLDSDGTKLADQLYPDWPCLLIGNRHVQKNNISFIMKKVCTLNDKFRSAEFRKPGAKIYMTEEKIKRLEIMCQTHLHLITVSHSNAKIDQI